MLQEEFEKRVNFKVSSECYHTLIEPEYNNSSLNKDIWCKQWKRKGGIQKAYDFEIARLESMSDQYTSKNEEGAILSEAIENLRKELSQAKDEVSKWKNLYINLIARMKGLINDFEIF